MATESSLNTFFERLVSLSQRFDQIQIAIAKNDEPALELLLDGLDDMIAVFEQARQAVDWAGLPEGPQVDELKAFVTQYTARIEQGVKVLARFQAPPEPEPEVSIFSRITPDIWNPEIDLIIVIDGGGDVLLKQARAEGQQRIIVFLPETATPSELEEQWVVVQSMQDLMTEIQMLDGDPPEELVIWGASGSRFTSENAQSIQHTALYCLTQRRSNERTTDEHGRRWAINSVENIPNVARWPDVDCVDRPYEGKPMVLVSPGPSLTKNIGALKAYRDRVVVVAVSHVLIALEKAGISPDFVVALESQRTAYHFDGCDMDAIKGLILSVSVPSDLFQLGNTPTMLYTANRAERWIFETIDRDPLVIGGGSVSCTAFTLGVRWGCDPIILVGQDLAYTGGKVYTSLSVDGEATAELSEDGSQMTLGNYSDECAKLEIMEGKNYVETPYKVITVDGYYGGQVPTSQAFHFFKIWFENMARDLNDKITIINCTEGGAYIEGVEHSPFEETLKKYATEPVDVSAPLDQAYANDDAHSRAVKLRDAVRRVVANVDKAAHLAGRCQLLVQRARRNPGAQEQLNKKETELIAALKPLSFLALVDQKTIRETVNDTEAMKTMEGSLKGAEALYAVVLESVSTVAKPLRETLKTLEEMVGA